MGLHASAIGAELGRTTSVWSSRDAMLYALGVGSGIDELAFTTENTHGLVQQVLPTFAVIVGQPDVDLGVLGDIDPTAMVHGRQEIQLHGPIPANGAVDVVGFVEDLQDKGRGSHAVFTLVFEARDLITDEKLVTCRTTAIVRGAGGFGGERGSSTPRVQVPDREPDYIVVHPTTDDQALLYRLSGDRNPLHSDPWFAAEGGYPRPILHGLCTYGHAGRALLSTLCGGNVSSFGGMDGRFTATVVPGDVLTTSIWLTPHGAAFRTTASPDDRVVIGDGAFQFASVVS